MARSTDLITGAVIAAVSAVVGALINSGFGYLSHKGDVDARMIELSIGILRAEPTKESASLRDWAIQVINDRSDVKFDDAQKEALRKKELPFKGSDLTFFHTPITSGTSVDPFFRPNMGDPTAPRN
jgi:hypothetical protein